jgi:hypothetical protein
VSRADGPTPNGISWRSLTSQIHSCTKRTSRWFDACALTESGKLIFMPLPRFVAPISAPPPLAMTKVASMKHSRSSSASNC